MLIFTFSHLFSLENGLFWDEFVLTKFFVLWTGRCCLYPQGSSQVCGLGAVALSTRVSAVPLLARELSPLPST